MDILLDRLQRALAPQFTIVREIAGGGMGRVFLGQDVALERPVAIKVLRPELATAVGAERFLREARILARLRHPNILPVFQGGEADGLLYHVLEFQDGETLAQRLGRGRLTATELTRLSEGLLAALDAAHAAGVVHRDIKPSNIFVGQDRVVVGDFGIAHTDTTGDPLTDSGATLGTRAYMAPEQLRGAATSPQTDLFSTALVLVEAATGRRLDTPTSAALGVGSGVPRRMIGALRRALAEQPGQRWASAAAMRAALEGRSRRRWLVPMAGVVALLAWVFWPPPPPVDAGSRRFVLGLARFEMVGATAGVAWHDSVRTALAERLRGFPDFVADTMAGRSATLSLIGSVASRGDSLYANLYAQPGGSGRNRLLVVPAAGLSDWRPLVDSLVNEILVAIWNGEHGDNAALPRAALPRTVHGRERWMRAELAYRDGNWEAARDGYVEAETADQSCALCGYRIMDLDRWLSQQGDPVRLQALAANADRFPAEYREVIAAAALPLRERLDSLRALASRWPDFFDVHYLLGDELLHRGPMVGLPRHEAIHALRTARRLRPDFAGVAEHLAWAFLAEGQGDSARAVLDALERQHPVSNSDLTTAGLRAFHELAWLWRYRPEPVAAAATARVLSDPAILDSRNLAAGPRAMPALGVPEGAVGFGRQLQRFDRRDLVWAGMVAEWLGSIGRGRYRSAGGVAEGLRRQFEDPASRLASLQVAALGHAIGEPGLGDRHPADALRRLAGRGDLAGALRSRAGWSLALAEPPDSLPVDRGRFDHMQRARVAADLGDHAGAIRMTDSLARLDFYDVDPTIGAALRFLRAEWLGAVGRHAEAARELLWFEHSDFHGLPREAVEAAEVDWALGTLAMWRRARHLEADGESGLDVCRLYHEVARRWAGGDPLPAARSDSARARTAAIQCGVAP